MTAPELVAEVELHRAIWLVLRKANDARESAHDKVEETGKRPPVSTLPYVRARTDHLQAVVEAKQTDDLFIVTVNKAIKAGFGS